MKKIKILDITICIIALLILIFSYFFCFKKYTNNKDANIVEIYFKNELIDKMSTDVAFTSDIVYEITYQKDTGIIQVFKNNNDLIKEISYHGPSDFYNVIQMKDGNIKMIDASCRGKDCMEMEINKAKTMPIVCTNGLVVKVVMDKNKIDILS